jgi:hypothetical protein
MAGRILCSPEEERAPPLDVIRRQEVGDEQQGVLANNLRCGCKCQGPRNGLLVHDVPGRARMS